MKNFWLLVSLITAISFGISSAIALIEQEEEQHDNYPVDEDEGIERQTGIPQSIIKKLAELSKDIPISIRSKTHPNYRFKEPFDSKPSAIHQKTSNRPPVCGHLAERDEFTKLVNGKTKGINITDSSYGTPPKNKKALSANTRQKYHMSSFQGTSSVYDSHGRIFYARIIPRFKKATAKELDKARNNNMVIEIINATKEISGAQNYKGKIIKYKDRYFSIDESAPTAQKFFIQETESIQSILENIERGEYIVKNFIDGVLNFNSRNSCFLPMQADCKNLLDLAPDSHTWNYITMSPNDYDIAKLNSTPVSKQIMEFLLRHHGQFTTTLLLNKSVVLDTVETIAGETIVRPLMVQAGNNGHPITGDFDLMDVYLPTTLPELSFLSANTYTEGTEKFIEHAKTLRDIITLPPAEKAKKLANKKISACYLENDYTDKIKYPLYQVFKRLAKYSDVNGKTIDPMAKYLEPKWIKAQGNMPIGAYLLNCIMNISIGKNMFNHGTESFNPGNSEEFGVLDHFYQGKVFHTETEEECLDFYFHHKEYLATTFARVHPYYVRCRQPEPGKVDLSKYWLDLIKVQILHNHVNIIGDNQTIINDYNKYNPGFGDIIVEYIYQVKKMTESEKQNELEKIYNANKKPSE